MLNYQIKKRTFSEKGARPQSFLEFKIKIKTVNPYTNIAWPRNDLLIG